MSGGQFDYIQFKMKNDLAVELENMLEEHKTNPIYSEKTIEKIKDGLKYVNLATIFTQRIDWLLSGDDSEETFNRRLSEDLLDNYKKK